MKIAIIFMAQWETYDPGDTYEQKIVSVRGDSAEARKEIESYGEIVPAHAVHPFIATRIVNTTEGIPTSKRWWLEEHEVI